MSLSASPHAIGRLDLNTNPSHFIAFAPKASSPKIQECELPSVKVAPHPVRRALANEPAPSRVRVRDRARHRRALVRVRAARIERGDGVVCSRRIASGLFSIGADSPTAEWPRLSMFSVQPAATLARYGSASMSASAIFRTEDRSARARRVSLQVAEMSLFISTRWWSPARWRRRMTDQRV